ncbi:MAG: RDD family protein [Anaerolineae bacterium]
MYAQADKPKNEFYVAEKSKHDTELELATINSRFVALIIDSILAGIVCGFLGAVSGRGELGFLSYFIVQTAYQWYFLINRDGQTPGKSAMNIRVVKVDGSALNTNDVILRSIGYQINHLLLGLGWLTATADPNYQGIQDKMAKTYVVKA